MPLLTFGESYLRVDTETERLEVPLDLSRDLML